MHARPFVCLDLRDVRFAPLDLNPLARYVRARGDGANTISARGALSLDGGSQPFFIKTGDSPMTDKAITRCGSADRRPDDPRVSTKTQNEYGGRVKHFAISSGRSPDTALRSTYDCIDSLAH